MRKHTTVDIDMELLRNAAQALGTRGTIETIHAALADVVQRRLRNDFLNGRTSLTLDELKRMRAHRFAEDLGAHRA